MASVNCRTTFLGQGAYSSSKWAVEGLTETLRIEVTDHGIDVVAIGPGPVKTRFGERALASKSVREETDAYDGVSRLYDPETYDRRFLDEGIGSVQPERVAETVANLTTRAGRRT